ncbi:alpha/beta superfamily [Renibacterium salmoninarum ATCC 33209]|uniref:Alpha/beta superfamily n=1 Tax=Renibacterium salmoninarum (strain ATCC 33209 / DSM 20767 / JCM 11484 / NBRC 15589 / NCIMB 2235) TaxID=288705 RepID=A9WKW8_RENSM|nr:alpha/beta superfamily [Renibacterium salmoninarum ATCC 33209]
MYCEALVAIQGSITWASPTVNRPGVSGDFLV